MFDFYEQENKCVPTKEKPIYFHVSINFTGELALTPANKKNHYFFKINLNIARKSYIQDTAIRPNTTIFMEIRIELVYST